MGSMHAMEYAAMARGEGAVRLSLERSIEIHFSSNHYPPLPSALVPVAVRIIEGVNAGELDYDSPVELPDGITYRGESSAPGGACVEGWHLDAWLD